MHINALILIFTIPKQTTTMQTHYPTPISRERALQVEEKVKAEKYCNKFTWYGNYCEMKYVVPSIKKLKTPAWTHIGDIHYDEQVGYIITVTLFDDGMHLYDWDTVLDVKFPIIHIEI